MGKTLGVEIGAVLVAVVLFGAGWCTGRADLGRKIAADTAAAYAQARVADSERVEDSTAYVLYRSTHDSRVAGLESEARRLRAVAQGHLASDHARDSVLAAAATAGDSLPIVIAQRDEARLAAGAALERGDSLETAVGDLRRGLELADSTLASTRRSAEAREAALAGLNASLRVEVERLRGKDRIFGFIPAPSRAVMLLIGAAAGFCVAKC